MFREQVFEHAGEIGTIRPHVSGQEAGQRLAFERQRAVEQRAHLTPDVRVGSLFHDLKNVLRGIKARNSRGARGYDTVDLLTAIVTGCHPFCSTPRGT